jgi:GNAT superfamily N-acetyltransferase
MRVNRTFGKMRVKLREAEESDVAKIADLRSKVAQTLTASFGTGHWSGVGTEKGVRLDMKNSRVFMAHHKGRLIATLRLATKKPWAIDPAYFTASKRPLYLLSMAVAPELQRQGIGRQCMEQVMEIARTWPADAIRLDAYDGPAGAGMFYAKCGLRNVGKAVYRGCPLLYFERLIPDASGFPVKTTRNRGLGRT